MPTLKITPLEDDGIELDKRTYLPYEVSSDCPKCHQRVTMDMTSRYLSYPVTNARTELSFYHECGEGDSEWSHTVIVRLILEEAPGDDRG